MLMRKKLLTTLALLLMAVSGAWAQKYLYLDISGATATLKYGAVPDGKPYYQIVWDFNSYSDFENFKEMCTTISVDASCSSYDGEYLRDLFQGFKALTTINNLSNFNTSNVIDMNNMFQGCQKLTTLDLSSWNTSKVKDMGGMFQDCEQLSTLKLDPDKWDTSNVTEMQYLFYGCKKLTSLDLSRWNTSKVTNMSDMFAECYELTTLTLDPDKWNTSNVTNMSWMFEGCLKLASLDLTGWNTSKVTNMVKMFFYCEKLETIYVGDGWSTANVNKSAEMFDNCPKLTNWKDTNPIDKTHAHTGDGGYLTFGVAVRSDGAGSYWATYYNGTNSYTADANTKVYQAKVNSDKDAVVLTEVTGREIPAGKAVVLKSSASPVVLTPLATPTQALTGNELQGTDDALDTPGNAYCLSNETTGSSPRGVGFYLYTPSDGAKIPAHRAYLIVTGVPNTSRGFLGFGEDDGTTAIDNGKWKIDNSDGTIYDLLGRIVKGHPRKGIYVKNGKLVVIK